MRKSFLVKVPNKGSFFCNDKAFIITGDRLEYLALFLNSKIFKFCFKDQFPELLGDTREIRKVFFEQLPIKIIEDEEWFRNILSQILLMKDTGSQTDELQESVDTMLFKIYGLTSDEVGIILANV